MALLSVADIHISMNNAYCLIPEIGSRWPVNPHKTQWTLPRQVGKNTKGRNSTRDQLMMNDEKRVEGASEDSNHSKAVLTGLIPISNLVLQKLRTPNCKGPFHISRTLHVDSYNRGTFTANKNVPKKKYLIFCTMRHTVIFVFFKVCLTIQNTLYMIVVVYI